MSADVLPFPSSLPRLDGAAWLRQPQTQAVLQAIAAAGYEGRVVGGAVRNALIGKAVSDIDIATNAPPDEVMRLALAAGFAAVPTGIAHGTITVVAHHHPFEVTTLREDVETHGRHATVAFTADWAADARRRDFTINALYCAADGTVHDPLGGWPDLVARRIRFIGDAGQRIREDFLRILRFFRFHAEYADGAPDATGLHAAVVERVGLAQLSGERVRLELVKLLAAPGAVAAIETMAAYGLLTELLPVAPRLGPFARLAAAEERAGQAPRPMLRLALLTIAVAEDAGRVATRLRLSNEERAVLTRRGRRLRVRPEAGEAAAKVALYRLGRDGYIEAVLASWVELDRASEPVWLELLSLPDRWTVPRLPVSGNDVLARGVAPGAAVGRALGLLEEAWIAASMPDDRDWLLARLDGLVEKP
ncbi:MAG: CCA tRNA nucleotidyltransferase [Hyphomicrobiaceae bacterium]